jgi:uroporphyrinogen decarboxylase
MFLSSGVNLMTGGITVLDCRPDFERVISTLHHEEPDRVPLAEAAVDYEIMSQFLGREVTDGDLVSQVEFWSRAGYDYMLLTVGMMRPGRVTEDSQISKVIQHVLLEDTGDEDSDDAWNLWKRPRIHTEEDFDTFPWEEAAKLDFSKFHKVQPHLPDGMKIIATSGKIFTMTWMLMGFENFAVNLKLKPQFVAKVFEKVAQIQLAGLKQIVSVPNVAAVWAVDDVAFGTGPMVSPRAIRDYVFPWYEEFGKICHDNGLYLFFHSDGVLGSLVEDLIALGVDALHPIDPTCMDIEEVKKEVGDRLCLIGNISNEILEVGTPEEVAELTKKRLKALAPGGGYCLGSGNSVPYWAKIENYRAMIETGLRYGRYPINIG